MKKINIIYWTFTILFCLLMFGSAIPDLLSMQLAVDGFAKIGYPAYLVPFLGFAKMLGVLALLIPGYPRIREWAYAGLTFDLIGATYSIAASGEAVSNWAGMALPLALAAGSYISYHRREQLRKANPQVTSNTQQSIASLA